MKVKERTVCGIGINNADYNVNVCEKVNGKWIIVERCPYYEVWKSMIRRCYSVASLKRNKTYSGCYVCDEWLYFMTFRAWMIEQDWQGKDLDKDILIEGNKVYSPYTCKFLHNGLNKFLLDSGASRGAHPIGVDFSKSQGKFRARCRNPFTKKREYLGLFTCPNEAHEAWYKRKHQLAYQWANIQDDPDIAEALRERFPPKGE